MIDVTVDDLAEIQKLAGSASLDYLLNTVKLFSSVDLRMDSYSPLPLELALVESVLSQHTKEKAAEPQGNREWQYQRPTPPPSKTVKPIEQARPSSLVNKPSKVAESPASDYVSDPAEQPKLSEPLKMEDPNDLEYLRTHWKDFINSMRGEGSQGNLDARLRHACEPVEIEGQVLKLGFYHEFHKNYIDNRKYLHLIEKKLKEVFGHTYTVTCTMMPEGQKPELKPASSNHLVEAALSMGARIIEENAETEEK